jgi:hypothetical protein
MMKSAVVIGSLAAALIFPVVSGGCARRSTAAPNVAREDTPEKPLKSKKGVPVVNAHRMFLGALVADSFDGPALDAQTWHRPDWLVKNDPNLSVGIHEGHLRIAGVSRPTRGDHQYTGVLSTYFRETDVVLAARIRTSTLFDKPGRIRHLVHLCTGDWPDFFTEIDFGKLDTGPPRWHNAYVNKIWEYSGYRKYVNPTLPATGKEATDWNQVVIVHDGTTHAAQNYLVQAGAWKPVGPTHKIKMNHSHVELKVDVGVPDVRVEVDFDDVRLYPNPARHPVTIVVHSPLNKTRTAPAYAIEKLKVRLIEKDSKQLLGEGVTDEGGQAQVTLRSGVLYPVAARIEVSNDEETLLTSSIPQEGVRGLYPSDIWVVRLPAKTMDR